MTLKSPLFHIIFRNIAAHNFPQQSGALYVLSQHRDRVNIANVNTEWIKRTSTNMLFVFDIE